MREDRNYCPDENGRTLNRLFGGGVLGGEAAEGGALALKLRDRDFEVAELHDEAVFFGEEQGGEVSLAVFELQFLGVDGITAFEEQAGLGVGEAAQEVAERAADTGDG